MSIGSKARTITSLLISTALSAPFLAGCVTTGEKEVQVAPQIAHSYLSDKPDELRDHFYVSLIQGQRNKVLNDMRLGVATMAMGRFDLAEQLFDDALLNIEAIYADNEQAKKARQLFVKEQAKDFKGEPYERVMAYFYRGLLYMRAGDYENARASFKGGMLQDAFAEEEQHRADFALMPYLQSWAARCSGNLSSSAEDLKEFRSLNSTAALPVDEDNVLVLVETGSAPTKYSVGDKTSVKPRYLRFSRASGQTSLVTVRAEGQLSHVSSIVKVGVILALDRSVVKAVTVFEDSPAAKAGMKTGDEIVMINGAPVLGLPLTEVIKQLQGGANTTVKATIRRDGVALPELLITRSSFNNASLIENIYRQAVTRGGREFDSVLANKAQFKDTANTVGNAAIVGAAAAATYATQRNDNNAAIAAGIMLLIAVAAKTAAANAQPEADTRYWDNIPDSVYAVTLDVPKSTSTVSVDFLSVAGTVTKSNDVQIWRAGNCGLAWTSEYSAKSPPPRAPNSAPKEVMYQALVIPPLPELTNEVKTVEMTSPEATAATKSGLFDNVKTGFLKIFATTPASAATESESQE